MPNLKIDISRRSSAIFLTLQGHLSDQSEVRTEAGSTGNPHPKLSPARTANHYQQSCDNSPLIHLKFLKSIWLLNS